MSTKPSWAMTSYGHALIPFRSFQFGEVLEPGATANVSRIWRTFEDLDLYKAAGLDDKMIERLFNEKLKQFGLENVQVPTPFCDDPRLWNDCHGDLYLLSIPADGLSPWLKKFIQDLTEYAPQVGGDDTFFDYYPDHWDIVWQLVPVVEDIVLGSNVREMAEFGVQVAVNVRYFDSENPDDLESEFYTVLPGYTTDNGKIRQQLIRRGYIEKSGEFTERGKQWILEHKFDELLTR